MNDTGKPGFTTFSQIKFFVLQTLNKPEDIATCLEVWQGGKKKKKRGLESKYSVLVSPVDVTFCTRDMTPSFRRCLWWQKLALVPDKRHHC